MSAEGTPPSSSSARGAPQPTAGERVAQMVDRVTGDAGEVVRAEIDRTRRELLETAQRAGRGAALLGGAGLLGALAAGASAAVLLRALDRVLPRPAAAALAMTLFGAGAAGLAVAGAAELRRALHAAPGVSRQP